MNIGDIVLSFSTGKKRYTAGCSNKAAMTPTRGKFSVGRQRRALTSFVLLEKKDLRKQQLSRSLADRLQAGLHKTVLASFRVELNSVKRQKLRREISLNYPSRRQIFWNASIPRLLASPEPPYHRSGISYGRRSESRYSKLYRNSLGFDHLPSISETFCQDRLMKNQVRARASIISSGRSPRSSLSSSGLEMPCHHSCDHDMQQSVSRETADRQPSHVGLNDDDM